MFYNGKILNAVLQKKKKKGIKGFELQTQFSQVSGCTFID